MFRSPLVGAAILALLFASACEKPADPAMKETAEREGANQLSAPHEEAEEHVEPEDDDHGADDHDGHDHDTAERLAAHTPGSGMLAAALDGAQLTITFEAPLASMVGFEHEADTDAEAEALDALEDAFVRPGEMVSINTAAECLPQMTTSGTQMSGGHGELQVEHVYSCGKPNLIDSIEFLLMANYPALETIDAIFLSATDQVAGTLTQSNPMLQVR